MAAFATASELASWLQKDLDTATATLALSVASGQIRRHVGWSITEETLTDLLVDGTGRRSIILPTLHLTAVASVEEDGVALTYDVDYTWTREGRLIRNGRWLHKARTVKTTYTHGYTTGAAELDDVKGVCLDLAGDIYDNPTGLRSYTVGGASETYAGGSVDLGAGLTDTQRNDLAPYRLLALVT